MRRILAVSVLAALALAACSSSKPTAIQPAPSENTQPSDGSGNTSGSVAAACKLLTDDEVKAAIGTTAAGHSQYPTKPAKHGTPAQSGCTWGELGGDGAVLGVQISNANGGPIDPLKAVLASIPRQAPTDVVPGGALYDKALIPFGGGQGQSIAWTHNGDTVVVGLVPGDRVKTDQAQLEAAARAVNAKLG